MNSIISETPFFSVVIPVYNKELYVARSINSVLNQTFQDFELIIVCDPSTDNSNAEVTKVYDPRIRVFHRDIPGPGGYAARNMGLAKANGKWIVFLDADDMYYSGHLESFWRLSKKYPNEKLLASAKIIDQNGIAELDKFSVDQKVENKIFSFLDYLMFSVVGDKPFNMNSIGIHISLIENQKLFPDGRVSRSGDIYTWVHLAFQAKTFVWSSHVGSHTYKDVVGVSKSNAPSISLNHEMVNELCRFCTSAEQYWLKKYANRLISTAFFEQKIINGKVEMGLLNAFYWRNDFVFCLLWFMRSLLPLQVLGALRKLKNVLITRLKQKDNHGK